MNKLFYISFALMAIAIGIYLCYTIKVFKVIVQRKNSQYSSNKSYLENKELITLRYATYLLFIGAISFVIFTILLN